MKLTKRILTILAVTAFGIALSLPLATSAEPGPAKTTATTAMPAPGPHPEIDDAMRLLRQADDHLAHAAHDFGGHRDKARHHIAEALAELDAALKYADTH
jgi:predicted anti-sigma-YlaC factor YlaD